MDCSGTRTNNLCAPANICIIYGCNQHIVTSAVVLNISSSNKKKINADS